MAVMIGIDPHTGSRTAVAVGAAGQPLGKICIRACPAQAGQLVTGAAGWPERTWAVEGAPGLGRLLGQQLVAAGGSRRACHGPHPGPGKQDPENHLTTAKAKRIRSGRVL